MNSKEALENIAREFDTNCYTSFLLGAKNGYFNEIFYQQLKIIYKDLERLEKLEEIEKELGIDLLTLFKALKQDYIYYKHHYRWDDRYKINKEYIQGLKYADDNTPVFWTDDCGEEHMVYIKDYGKKWALTREVLGNDK